MDPDGATEGEGAWVCVCVKMWGASKVLQTCC